MMEIFYRQYQLLFNLDELISVPDGLGWDVSKCIERQLKMSRDSVHILDSKQQGWGNFLKLIAELVPYRESVFLPRPVRTDYCFWPDVYSVIVSPFGDCTAGMVLKTTWLDKHSLPHSHFIGVIHPDDNTLGLRFGIDVREWVDTLSPEECVRSLASMLQLFPASYPLQYMDERPDDDCQYAWYESTIGDEMQKILAIVLEPAHA